MAVCESATSLLMLDVEGLTLTPEDEQLMAHPATGGVILFSRNYQSRSQLCELVAAIRAIKPDMLIAVDQEGGRVQRFRDGFTRLPPMSAFGALYDENEEQALEAAFWVGRLMAEELRQCDIDISFAPVLDLDYGVSSVIGDRSFHAEPDVVIALCRQWIAGMQAAGMQATGKHFPGHGAVEADSHLELPIDERDEQVILACDAAPFARLADQLAGIMPAHLVYTQADSQPAGFSRYWLQDVLRQRFGFQGVIFSDDLGMAGAACAGDYAARARAALEAGCDMVLVCNDRAGARQVIQFLEQAEVPPRYARPHLLAGTAYHAMQDDDVHHARQWAARLCDKESRDEIEQGA